MPHAFRDLAGQEFGFLTALHRGVRVKRRTTWVCRCRCGSVVSVRGSQLTNGKRKFCCAERHISDRAVVAPMSESLRMTKSSWSSMVWRCRAKSGKSFATYASRGITVCDRWMSFENFLSDMGERPSRSVSIGRIDNDRGYEPGNCRWETHGEQARNTRRTVRVEWQGESRLLCDLAVEFGIGLSVVNGRLKRGWELGVALTSPVRPKRPNGSSPPFTNRSA